MCRRSIYVWCCSMYAYMFCHVVYCCCALVLSFGDVVVVSCLFVAIVICIIGCICVCSLRVLCCKLFAFCVDVPCVILYYIYVFRLVYVCVVVVLC